MTAELQRAGFAAENVRHVFLSHIHFDHAGAAWRFAELGATIYVHPRGAPHLIDPARLIESATRIYGDEMERLWGQFAPIARGASEGNRRTVMSYGLLHSKCARSRHRGTPAITMSINGRTPFSVVILPGCELGGGPPIPPFVPPELHIESWLESIEKIRSLQREKIVSASLRTG